MLKPEYHERIEQAMWRRAGDKRVPAWWRLRLRFQANRFRTLARGATKSNATDEPTDESIGHIAGQLLIGSEEAWKIVGGNGRTQGATEGVAKSQKEPTFDEETWAAQTASGLTGNPAVCYRPRRSRVHLRNVG